MTPVVFIAETRATGAKQQPFDPGTQAGRRLAQLLGVESVPASFPVVALLDRWPGRTSHGKDFPAGVARHQADWTWVTLPDDASLILVGQRVAAAFEEPYGDARFFRWITATRDVRPGGVSRPRTHRIAVVPHPSGANRWWNEPRNAARAARFFRGVSREAVGNGR